MAGDDLKLKSEQKPASVKVFNCPSCGAGVVLRAAGQSVTAVCGSCAAIIDSTNENYKVIEKASKKGKRDQVINLGQRGKLHGVLWEVIGYVERTDGSGVYSWSEYLLFNPMKGFRWLTEFDGHWNYIITTKTQPSKEYIGRRKARYLNKDYFLFHTGTAKVTFVVGEFYWQVKQGESVEVEDYVSPPEILSCEKSDKEVVWSLGQYIDASDVKSAFQITKSMPLQSGVAPNQPSTAGHSINQVGKYWGAFLGVIVLIQFAMMVLAKNETVYSGQINYSASDVDRLKVSPQFELKHGTTNLEVLISAPIQNNWLEVQSDLVNDQNGNTSEFEQGIEFYSGRDSDGYWSEGSQQSSIILSSVPAGTYHLNLEAAGPVLPALGSSSALPDVVVTPPEAINKTENWPNGSVKSIEPMVNGRIEGLAKYYFQNGQLNSEIPFRNGEKNGKYKVFNQDGTLQQTGTNINGKLNGNVRWFDSKGNITRDVFYADGVQVSPNSMNRSGDFTVNVTVKRDVTTWSNFLWAIFLISIYPLFVWWRSRSFELNRWSQSDFSPYYQHQEEN